MRSLIPQKIYLISQSIVGSIRNYWDFLHQRGIFSSHLTMENPPAWRANLTKWLPYPSEQLKKWYEDIIALNRAAEECAQITVIIVDDIQKDVMVSYDEKEKNMKDISSRAENLMKSFESLRSTKPELDLSNRIYKFKADGLFVQANRALLVVARFCRNFIFEVATDCCKSDDKFRKTLFGFINVYNRMVQLKCKVFEEPNTVNIYRNDCPLILIPLKKISIYRLLKKIAKEQAQENCHELIECLLKKYEPSKKKKVVKTPASEDVEVSESSSLEIYRALTKHMTPPEKKSDEKKTELQLVPVASTSKQKPVSENLESIEALVRNQDQHVIKIVEAAQEISSDLFGVDNIEYDCRGGNQIKESALKQLTDYYQEVSWASISGILDHVVLWWSPEALAVRHSRGAQHLKDWLQRFIQSTQIPASVRPTLLSLCDALRCHVTVTCWDELFRSAYISAFQCASGPCSNEGTDTGRKFCEVFQLLVTLSNECEIGGEWVVGAPLEELPLSEQILILHRLDHSIHTMRLWVLQESREIAHTWDLESFFLLVKEDLNACIEELSYLKLADHTNALKSNETSVDVYVCAKMRAKLVSEVNANIQLLKETSAKCISTLAKICRVVSLANLHMSFPKADYWKKGSSSVETQIITSSYVDTYLKQVLLPVLEVIEDPEISNMILKIMCEAWLDYIYLHRFKFSEHGALQLLTDFAHVSRWVADCSIISQNVRGHLLKNEVLRRCEGVGRLLLRHPGEAIAMQKKISTRTNENGSPESLGLERMPAEMYVPNQQQWLELRASKFFKFHCCTE